MSPKTLKACVTRYVGLGWTGYVTKDCRNSFMMVPTNYAPWLWGWPNRFMARMQAVGTTVFVISDMHGDIMRELDTSADLKKLPPDFAGGIWTDRVEVVVPLLARRGIEKRTN
jgi:glycerophosphoryl diester phosphodiesterase